MPDQLADSAVPLAGLARFDAMQVIDPDAGMGIDDAKWLGLSLQMRNDAGERDVFQDIGMVSGVIGMAVVHPRNTKKAPAAISAKPMR